MFNVNGKPSKEKIEKYDDDRFVFYRFQKKEYEIEGEYTESWGMVFGSKQEAIDSTDDWDMEPDEMVLPGKSCMTTFKEILNWISEYSYGNDYVLLVFNGSDTYATGHDGEYVAEYYDEIEAWDINDVSNYANEHIWNEEVA